MRWKKISHDDPKQFSEKERVLLSQALDDGTPEVRWHLVAILSRLDLTPAEAAMAMKLFVSCVRDDESRTVKMMALQAAADVARQRSSLERVMESLLDWAHTSPWPSLRARARKLAQTPKVRDKRA